MNVVSLALIYLRDRWLNTALNVVLLAVGVSVVSALLLVSHQMTNRLDRDGQGIDLVVGASGSPLQLFMSAVLQADAPVGNVPMEALRRIERDRFVAQAMPLAMGDSFRGARVVGATPAYPEHYGGELSEGRYWEAPLEAVFGASAAARIGVSVGDHFVSSHGMSEGGAEHAHAEIEIVGILAPTGTVIDRLVLTSIESVWAAHGISASGEGASHGHDDDHEAGDHEGGDDAHAPGAEITAILIAARSPLARNTVPAALADMPGVMTAVPATETTRLLSLLGSGLDLMRGLAWVVIAAAGLGVFVTLLSAMRDRAADIAVMRVMGASRTRVFAQVLAEGLITAAIGTLAGLVIGHFGVELFARTAPQARDAAITGFLVLPEEAGIAAVALALGALGAVLPAAIAYRIDIVRTLSQ